MRSPRARIKRDKKMATGGTPGYSNNKRSGRRGRTREGDWEGAIRGVEKNQERVVSWKPEEEGFVRRMKSST